MMMIRIGIVIVIGDDDDDDDYDDDGNGEYKVCRMLSQQTPEVNEALQCMQSLFIVSSPSGCYDDYAGDDDDDDDQVVWGNESIGVMSTFIASSNRLL